MKETKELIAKYNFISVREDYAKTMLQDYYGYKNAVHVVDPTLAYDGNFWRKYAPKSKIKGDYILIYNLNRSKEFDDYAIELSKRTGLPIYFLCRRYDQFVRPGKSILVPEVFEFITLIDTTAVAEEPVQVVEEAEPTEEEKIPFTIAGNGEVEDNIVDGEHITTGDLPIRIDEPSVVTKRQFQLAQTIIDGMLRFLKQQKAEIERQIKILEEEYSD